MEKEISNLAKAVEAIPDGAVIMIGGFGGSSARIELIHALIDRFQKKTAASQTPGLLDRWRKSLVRVLTALGKKPTALGT